MADDKRPDNTPDPDTAPRRPTCRELLERAQRWITDNPDARVPVAHRHGVPWDAEPPPSRLHRCRAQSWGSCGPFELVERCPCGGTRLDGRGPWLYRNRRHQENFGGGPQRGGENIGEDDDLPLLVDMREALSDRGDPW